MANLFARHGDSVAVYKPGYDAVTFLSSEDGQLTANIPLFRSNARYYSLLSGSGAKFVQSGSGVILEATGARAEANSSFVIYDGQYGADIRLTVLEANPLYIRFRSSDGTEFCYPVGENAKMSGMRDERIGISSIPQNGGGFAYPHTPAQFPSIQSGVNSIPQMR